MGGRREPPSIHKCVQVFPTENFIEPYNHSLLLTSFIASFLKGDTYTCICHSLSSQFLNQLQPQTQRSSSELISP